VIACFPTYARRIPGDTAWEAGLAGMVTHPLPETSRRRSVAMAVLRRLLELPAGAETTAIFEARAKAFLFERAVGRRVELSFAGRSFDGGATDRIGHFARRIVLAEGDLPAAAHGRMLEYEAAAEGFEGLRGRGYVELVEEDGVSVISDIDDTIKLTDVHDRRELLANTFLREFRPVPGMAELYARWQRAGAVFHYVSASPWQLAGCLAGFFEQAGLPPGSMHLKLFRLKDSTPLGRLPSKKRSKQRAIEQILNDFPYRRFILVGDSGEKDLDIYTAIARRRPGQVGGIAIRRVPPRRARGPGLAERLARASSRLSPGLLQVFDDAAELEHLVSRATA